MDDDKKPLAKQLFLNSLLKEIEIVFIGNFTVQIQICTGHKASTSIENVQTQCVHLVKIT